MAFANINFPHTYWRNLGLEYLYMPEGIPDIKKGRPSETKIRQTPPPANFRRPEPPPINNTAPVAAPKKKTAKKTVFTPLPVAEWPEAWQRRFQKTRPGKIIWTYWKLGEDLSAGQKGAMQDENRKIRSAFFKNFFQDLRQPAGTHIFWPTCLPDASQEPQFNVKVFWSGANFLDSLGVVILGSQAARTLMPDKKLGPLDEARMAGKIVWILRDPDALADNPAWYQMALGFLRNSFQQYLRND